MTCILDIRGLVLRAYHGCQDRSIPTQDGLTAAWEVAADDLLQQVLIPLFDRHTPRQIIAVWDSGNVHRLSISGKYKARRLTDEKDPALKAQMKALFDAMRELLAGVGVKQVRVPGEEADDVIAHLVEQLPGPKMIHTVDQDLIVLAAHPDTHVVRREHLFSAGDEFEGLPVRFVSLRKSLVGDSTDGYSGVPGFGEKRLADLWQKYGAAGFDWLMQIIDADQAEALLPLRDHDPLLGMLFQQWSDWRTGWRLAKLEPKACYGSYRGKPKRPTWDVRVPAISRLLPVLKTIGELVTTDSYTYTETQLAKLKRWLPTETLIEAKDAERLVALMPEILASPVVSYDFESSDKAQHACFRQNDKDYVDVLSQEPAGISINYGDNLQHTVYISFDHLETENFDHAWATWVLQSLDSRPEPCVVQNAAFELAVAQKQLGYMPRAPYDTAIMASYVDENFENGLKAMSQRWFNYRQASYAETTKGRRMDEMSALDVLSYGCDDALLTSHLFDLFGLIMQLEGSWEFYRQHEVQPAVNDAWSFLLGTLLDLPRLVELREENTAKLAKTEAQVRKALIAHPSQGDPQHAAQALLGEWWLTEKYRYLRNPEGMKAGYEALWARAWKACFYEHAERTETSVMFETTPGDLSRVVKLIDPQAPGVTKLTKKGLEEYDLELSTYLSKLKAGTDHHLLLTDFQELLWNARENLAPTKRKGKDYERLQSFGQAMFDLKLPKKVTTTGTTLNFGSGPQMQGFLYGLLRLPVRRRSKATRGSLRDRERLSGSPATGIKAVDSALVWDVREDDWRRPILLDYKEIAKARQLESLYFSKYPNWVHPEDGKLHPQIRNCGTVTRRPAGNSPNMLQISKGPMRSMFPAGPGRVFVSLDFASQEIQITACASRDPVMLEAFTSNPRRDIHSLTASGITHRVLPRLGIPLERPMSYTEFMEALHGEDEALAKACKVVRNTYAKACIAEGELVKTSRGLVPIEKVDKTDLLWDGIEWVRHDGVIYKGIQEVITYDGLTATGDHVVYLEGGGKTTFEEVAFSEARPKIASGESKFENLRNSASDFGGFLENCKGKVTALCDHALHFLRAGEGPHRGEPYAWKSCYVSLQPKEISRAENVGAGRTVPFDEMQMYERKRSAVSRLWGAWNRVQVLLGGRVCELRNGGASPPNLQGCTDRPDRQQWSLRAWKPEAGKAQNKPWEHQEKRSGGVPRGTYAFEAFLACAKNFTSRVALRAFNSGKTTSEGGLSRADGGVQEVRRGRAKVFDIVNAGPRNRFTVSGKIVSNCNFGIVYGSSALGIAETLQIPKEQAEELMDGFFSLYKRIQPWQREIADFARTHGYVLMPFGSRRHAVEDLWSDDRKLSGRQDRQLANAIIQSGAAEILKVVRQRLVERQFRERFDMRSVFMIYDEVTATVPEELAYDYILELAEVMRVQPPGYPVPMEVEASVGYTWGSQVEIGIPTPQTVAEGLLKLKQDNH